MHLHFLFRSSLFIACWMSRALVPLTLGAATGGWWYWIAVTTTRFGGERLGTWVTGSLVSLLASDLGAFGESLDQLISGVWKLGGLFLVWELRHEICWVLHIIVLGFIRFLQFANCCALWLDRRRVVCYLPWSHSSQLRLPAEQWTEQNSVLTCMAAAGAGGVPYPIGSFLLVSRPPNWDEVWLAGYTPGSMDALARTTFPGWQSMGLGAGEVSCFGCEDPHRSSRWFSTCPSWSAGGFGELALHSTRGASVSGSRMR